MTFLTLVLFDGLEAFDQEKHTQWTVREVIIKEVD
jgi:hypothetical protein